MTPGGPDSSLKPAQENPSGALFQVLATFLSIWFNIGGGGRGDDGKGGP